MAKIVATYDTETKGISVTIDGVDQGPISHFSCYNEKYSDESMYGSCCIEGTPEKENGVTYRKSAYASKYLPEASDKEKLGLYFRDCLHKK